MCIKMFAKCMQCELCGAKAKGPLKMVRIEGAELSVCGQCEKYGTEVQQPTRPAAAKRPGVPMTAPQSTRRRRDVFDMMVGEIVEDYGERIRQARVAKGWTTKELALAVKERELLIKRIEKGDLIPEDEVRVKLEKALDIRLIDVSEEEAAKRRTGPVVPTLGDVISLKRGKK